MTRLIFVRAVLGVAALVLSATHAGAAKDSGDADRLGVVLVKNGINHLTLDGHAALAIRARRDNYNAHGFDVVTFYVIDNTQSAGMLNLVPVFGDGHGGGKERDDITVGGGADCLLRDFRLLAASGKQAARLIVAERDMGDSYIAPGTVHFTYYELTTNADGVPGWPPLYFEARQQIDSRQPYCDVDQAFDRELHLGPSSG